MNQLLVLFIAIPFLAFLISLFWQNKSEKAIGKLVRFTKVLYILVSVSFAVWWIVNGVKPVSYHLATVYQTNHFVFAFELFYDEVTAVFSVIGALLFFLVATFSKYYMHRDQGYKRFFNTILLFAAGYNFIILSGNFETLFIGWEIKGVCSFLLIAFYRNRYLPVKNAFKAISYYRISDVSLMLAMWMMHHLTQQNILFSELSNAKSLALQTGNTAMAAFIVCMLILPAAIKSAQFPFTAWLPRAMEGPTSSSAIFYGSLSVHIGVFLLLRTHPFWEDMLWAKIAIIVIGAATAIVATLIARVQPTVKTQIAYSSAAQIGLMFIEIALGFHWLVLIHFAGNAFLRTYQLLVSPSVLNYLVHHQYFHYKAPQQKPVSKLAATLYMLGIKEWHLDSMMFTYLWSPFKWLGKQVRFLQSKVMLAVVAVAGVAFFIFGQLRNLELSLLATSLPLILMSIALAVILFAFAYRGSAIKAWIYLFISHLFLIAAVLFNADHINTIEIVFYISGIIPAFLLGYYCLNKIRLIDKDILLNRFHGYVYEQENTGLLFLFSAIGLLGFPVTAAFIGLDVFFTYVHSDQFVLIVLMALCLLFIELSAFRILLRIFMGPHKKLDHPVAFRSS
ncbi:proton-conducting transporter membrane subunit [Lacibacter sp. H375]|uniref:proton-conducting transporter transmembrane domain-containing protein n=1 Tax=Lacibacter sp. H375 TaxID=3133424 RepID=UPI0030BC87A4